VNEDARIVNRIAQIARQQDKRAKAGPPAYKFETFLTEDPPPESSLQNRGGLSHLKDSDNYFSFGNKRSFVGKRRLSPLKGLKAKKAQIFSLNRLSD